MKKEKNPTIVSLAILTLITSILWIFFSLYRVFTKKTEINVPKEIISSLEPSLDVAVISEIENRVFIEQNQIPDSVITIESDITNLNDDYADTSVENTEEQSNQELENESQLEIREGEIDEKEIIEEEINI